jgi:hypothetical protein
VLSRVARPLLVTLALGLPFVLTAQAAARLVGPMGQAWAVALSRVMAPLAAPAESGAPEVSPEPEPPEPDVVEVAVAASKGAKRPGPAKLAPKPAVPSALFVSAEAVLKLAESAARPRGSFVAATATTPAGLRLSGVSGLGIGVQDGDILIEALGMTPRASGQIIGAIIEARAKNARYLSGTLWRRGHSFRITVEQPYLRQG